MVPTSTTTCQIPGPHVCSILCALPPYMLEKVAVNGDEQQRQSALQALQLSAQFRGRREAVGGIAFMAPTGTKRRTIFDAKGGTNLPGDLVRSESDPPTGDEAVDDAFEGSGKTYDFFSEIYQRNSIDNRGLRLDSTIRYGQNYENAFWNGSQMVYGEGDGQLFQRFTKCLDIIAHELTHGIISYTAALEYSNQSGALNESFADVFGSLVKQRSLNQTADQADWLVGAGLFTPKVRGVAVRSLKAPGTAYDDPILGKDPQPVHMQDLFTGPEDNGGVHLNSGIANHAFYIAATEIGGYAWEKAGHIWYVSLTRRLQQSSDFADAAQETISAAGELFGQNSLEQQAVQKGWQMVGVI